MKHILQISRIAVKELVYEKVFYLLFSFVGLALILGILLGQLTYGEQAKLTLDFMLGCANISMVLFSIFMGISLFQRELHFGSISMLLSKPISRNSFLIGKYLGQIVIQLGVIVAMTAVIMVTSLKFETVSHIAILQSTLMMFFETCVITAITYFFAVNSGSVTASIATLAFFVVGHYNFNSNGNKKQEVSMLKEMIAAIIPNLEIFNLKNLASYGITSSWHEIGLASIYALVCMTLFLIAASLTFGRKDILT